jgi:hypothetical protein
MHTHITSTLTPNTTDERLKDQHARAKKAAKQAAIVVTDSAVELLHRAVCAVFPEAVRVELSVQEDNSPWSGTFPTIEDVFDAAGNRLADDNVCCASEAIEIAWGDCSGLLAELMASFGDELEEVTFA